MREIERRLAKLETVTSTATPDDFALVIYDAATGLPFKPIPHTTNFTIWIPDNGRKDNENGKH